MFMVHIQEGQQVQIGNRLIRVTEVIQPGQVRIEIDGEDLPTILSWDRKLELFPSVKVSIKRHTTSYSKRVRLIFEAPRHIYIRELPYEPGDGLHGIGGGSPAGA